MDLVLKIIILIIIFIISYIVINIYKNYLQNKYKYVLNDKSSIPVSIRLIDRNNSKGLGSLMIVFNTNGDFSINQEIEVSARLYPDDSSDTNSLTNKYKNEGLTMLLFDSIGVSKIKDIKRSEDFLSKDSYLDNSGKVDLVYNKQLGYYEGDAKIVYTSSGDKSMEIFSTNTREPILTSLDINKFIQISSYQEKITNELVIFLTVVLVALGLYTIFVDDILQLIQKNIISKYV